MAYKLHRAITRALDRSHIKPNTKVSYPHANLPILVRNGIFPWMLIKKSPTESLDYLGFEVFGELNHKAKRQVPWGSHIIGLGFIFVANASIFAYCQYCALYSNYCTWDFCTRLIWRL